MVLRSLFVLIFIIMTSYVTPVLANAEKENQLPEFRKLRFDEDYSNLQDTGRQDDFIYLLKHMSLPGRADAYASIGGEVRLRYEYTHSPGFGAYPQDKRGVFLQRYTLHSDINFSKNTRLFVQLNSALEAGRNSGPSPVDENKLEFQNLFFDYTMHTDTTHQSTLRLGRQEMSLGSGRLVDVREGPNVRRTFDGARIILQHGKWNSSIFAIRPRSTYSGVFDDRADKNKALWGLYMVSTHSNNINQKLDFYYLGFSDTRSRYEQGMNRERRHSLGIRMSADNLPWDYNWELVYQFGKFGNGNIRAWTLATETGYQWQSVTWKPRLALSANIASGDKNPNDPNLGSFNALFPRGNYFSQAAVIGPRNFFNLHPYLTVHPDDDWSLTADINFFWRKETSDGAYGPSGNLVRASNGSNERFVGSAVSLNSEWSVNKHLSLIAIYAHWFPGTFLKDTGASEPIDFVELTMQYKF